MANAVFTFAIGLLIGLGLFAGVSAIEGSWSKQHRRRFSLGMERLCHALFAMSFLTTLGSLLFWLATRQATTSMMGFGNFLVNTELMMMPIASLVLVVVLGCKSGQGNKPSHRKQVALTERLLPTD